MRCLKCGALMHVLSSQMGALKEYDTFKALYEDLNPLCQNENKETKGIKVEMRKRQRVI